MSKIMEPTTHSDPNLNPIRPNEPELDLYTIPSYSSWFSWHDIHETERVALREFFDGSSITRTPKIYKEYRDFIINKYREDPSRRLTFTEIRKSLVGDVSLLNKVFLFLNNWGLINFSCEKNEEIGLGSGNVDVRVEDGAPNGVRIVEMPDKLKPISVGSVQSSDKSLAYCITMTKLFGMVLVLLFHSFLSLASASQTPTVIIIGAGMSGISAAKTLQDAGIRDILILEATDRIGGRVMKTQFSGYAVEMGANWLFGGGPVHNPVLEMAKKVKLKTSLNDYDNLTSNTYKQDGGLYPKRLVEAIDKVAVARDDFCAEFSTLLTKKVKNDVDISILAGQRLFKQEPKTPLEMVIDYYHNDYEDGEPPKVTSLKHTYPRNEFVDHGEDPYFVADPRGFEIVVQYLAKQFLSSLKSDPRLKLNKVVREIIYSKNGVAVKTEDGSIYKAKYAIVSVSVGVLQTDLIDFRPKLPLWKRLAISDFSMTIYTKIFLKFPYKFWPSGPGTEFFLYTHVRRGYYPLWQHLENEYPGSNILFVTVTAEESRRVEQLSDQEVEAEVMAVLKTLFGNNIPKPEDILVPRWGLNRFYKGSYSNWPDKYNQNRHDQLGDPVGPVYFTGEHNSNKYIGYVTGAYFTGIDTANDLLGCIKNQTCRGYNSQHM